LQIWPRVADPLNAIIDIAKCWRRKPGIRQDRECSGPRKIQASGKHLLSLINDVLDLSKIEAGKMVLHLETFEVSQVIEG